MIEENNELARNIFHKFKIYHVNYKMKFNRINPKNQSDKEDKFKAKTSERNRMSLEVIAFKSNQIKFSNN